MKATSRLVLFSCALALSLLCLPSPSSAQPAQLCTPSDYCSQCSCQGWCRSDGSCVCDPDFFGDTCESEIVSNNISDAGLWMIIIAWIVLMPMLTVCCFVGYRQWSEGGGECCPSGGFRPTPRREVSFETTPETLQMNERTRRSAGGAALASPSVASAGGSGSGSSAAPANAEALISQVISIMGKDHINEQRARQALERNNWNMNETMSSLIGGAV